MITRLADILVIQAIRSWLETDGRRADRLARRAPGPADRPRDRAHPPRAGAALDRGLARPRAGDVALGVRGPLHGARRRAGDALRRAVADAGRADSLQRRTPRSASSRAGSATGRRPRSPGVQARRRHPAGRGPAWRHGRSRCRSRRPGVSDRLRRGDGPRLHRVPPSARPEPRRRRRRRWRAASGSRPGAVVSVDRTFYDTFDGRLHAGRLRLVDADGRLALVDATRRGARAGRSRSAPHRIAGARPPGRSAARPRSRRSSRCAR